MVKSTLDADLDLDEELQYKLREKLGTKTSKVAIGTKHIISLFYQFQIDGSIHKKRESK